MPPKTSLENPSKLPHSFVEQAGYTAFLCGQAITDSPYDMWVEYEKFHAWRQGWFQAAIKEELNGEG